MADFQDTIPEEIWKAIPDFPGYEVSDQGRVRSYWGWIGKAGGGTASTLNSQPQKILKPALDRGGYLYVNLLRNGKSYIRRIHRLVLLTFIGPSPLGHECRHLNGISTHCCLENLQWGTKSENESDKRIHGTVPNSKGANNSQAKLTEIQVQEIRDLYARGVLQVNIAKLFNVHKSTINNIILHKNWVHLPNLPF